MPEISLLAEYERTPGLRGRPLALVSDAGILKCVSSEAAIYGVRAGHTATSAGMLCRDLTLLRYDLEAYEDKASEIWNALAIESSVVQPAGPEVCYVQLETFRSPISSTHCQGMRVGGGRSKLIAYHAARKAEPGESLFIPVGGEAELLAPLPIAAAPGLNSDLLKRLQRLGIQTFGDLNKLPVRELRLQFRQTAVRLERLARGLDDDPVKAAWPPRRIEHEIAFEFEVVSLDAVRTALGMLAERISKPLLLKREYCRRLTLTLLFTDRTELQPGERLADPQNEAAGLRRAALRLLQRVRPQIRTAVVGVRLRAEELGIGAAVQLDLMDAHGNGMPFHRKRRIEAAQRQVQRCFGAGAVGVAGTLRQARRIHLWTVPLGRLLDEPIFVETDAEGEPTAFCRLRARYRVRRIQRQWRETIWQWDQLIEREAYRLETDPFGLFELHRVGGVWKLISIAD